jgi:hypothetical protein
MDSDSHTEPEFEVVEPSVGGNAAPNELTSTDSGKVERFATCWKVLFPLEHPPE